MNRDELLKSLGTLRDQVSLVRQNAVKMHQRWFAEKATMIMAMADQIIQAQGKSLPSTKGKRVASKHPSDSRIGVGGS